MLLINLLAILPRTKIPKNILQQVFHNPTNLPPPILTAPIHINQRIGYFLVKYEYISKLLLIILFQYIQYNIALVGSRLLGGYLNAMMVVAGETVVLEDIADVV